MNLSNIFFKFKFLYLTLLLLSCGYTPIYKNMDNTNLSIIITDTEGEGNINTILKDKFRIYQNSESPNTYEIKIISNFKKITLTKDNLGNATNYRLILNVKILTNKDKKDLSFDYNETFDIKKSGSLFDEENYEKLIIKNMISTIIDKFIFQISKIK